MSWYDLNLVMHASAGALGLVSMLVPLGAKKGGALHRRAGWVFTAAMGVAALTGLVIAIGWVVAPLQLNPPGRALEPERLARYATQVRHMGLFFGFLAVLLASATWSGVVAVRQRHGAIAWGNPIDRALAFVMLGLALALMAVGLQRMQPLFLGFGALGLVSSISDLRFFRRTEHERGAWLLRHLQAMLGGATAATTAFTTQAVGRALAHGGYAEWVMMVAWGLPVALGMLTSMWWTRRVRRTPSPRRARG